MPKDKNFCRKKLAEKLKEFARVSAELESIWDELGRNDDDAFFAPCDGYPFPYSFDEMDSFILNWVEKSVENLNKMMEDSI